MLSKLVLILATTITAGFPGPASANEGFDRAEPVATQTRSTATILPGTTLSWSSIVSGGVVTSQETKRADLTHNVVTPPETREKVYYVDFS